MGNRCAFFKRHNHNPSLGEIMVDFRHTHIRVSFEKLSASLSILSLEFKV